jgi:hypothetical protein
MGKIGLLSINPPLYISPLREEIQRGVGNLQSAASSSKGNGNGSAVGKSG